jgi:hypothetical protein
VTWAAFRSGRKLHVARPSKGEKSARWAWDFLAKGGAIVDMQLINGLWMCQRPNSDLDSVEAVVALECSQSDRGTE